MAEYIEREAVLALQYWDGYGGSRYGVVATDDIENIPAADVVSRAAFGQVMWERDTAMEQLKEHGIPFGGEADVVAVVRCKDCKHITPVEGGLPLCTLHNIACAYNDFCSYGERRDEDA